MRPPIIYVAHKFGGDNENLDKAERWAARLSRELDALFVVPWVPLCRHWPNCGDTLQRGLELDKRAIASCDALLAIGSSILVGMREEIEEAKRLGKPVLRITSDEGADDFWSLGDDAITRLCEEIARLS